MSFLGLGGNFKSALTADKKPSIGEYPFVLYQFEVLPRIEQVSHRVEEGMRHDRIMDTLMRLSLPSELSRIDRVSENAVDRAFSYLVSQFRPKAVFVKLLGDCFNSLMSFGVQRKSFFDEGSDFRIGSHVTRLVIARIPKRGSRRVFASAHAFRESSFHVSTQVSDVLIRHGKLDACKDDVVFGIVVALEGFDLLNHAVLEHPFEDAFVHRISSKSVYLPAENPLCFAGLDEFDHLIKHGTTRRLGRLGFLENFYHWHLIATRNLLHLDNLRLDRKRLAVFAFR